ncbi:MAG: tRNA (adenosine(37)-N6)-threonylcarbamoyltransferase complex ATPase subunit type 1 TsaE [Pseudotabrizicola sp.]|uniref:tRNA (adenosine(37)-N6)-threonylcarbamoyltransferase complex ATPase subunit type 1 TsaE n=1 Tax=Pseudotabrizicola sp. TaxID=2939647 RepID=UPI00271F7A86|nr:tRNA (adenosine(37)-N6)-threonylcarbamoyltransferase complex ATPase subunit type 1 TsaE [Pseudotabrizicola sp.]MDO8882765.1 tRNA (adenosine(37)-N6)-threonylcarbamoyltransferase complex ATPase subunit type 1 TsaE [Pseudotabrizicola sp.]MDP2083424.1 tRNA (adenosine(37)-N6)-threonylcarbamoyltransferase complex ATPase subunit type 1 TsaE [Pseudotabrizicola sp.]MDZ7574962.1 tRNA (adenosine(37)-N6)-threonylcarbamoyltransferase complex ATPase subunit type 1 TsaE [Pseudotabrizicola sp.]
MFDPLRHSLFLPTDEATDALGRLLAERLAPGDTVLLSGPIGAGKSHLSRAIIRARLGRMEDVPSPTFTLVQTYEDPAGDIWHADLYRLSHPDEVLELGLEDAFTTAICLVEWPDRLGPHQPEDAIHISLAVEGDGRNALISFFGRPELARALDG